MKVNKDDMVAGIPLIQIRDFLRQYRHGGSFTVAEVETELGVPKTPAELITRAMVDEGFAEPEIDKDEPTSETAYSVTKLGSRLCVARFVKRITRTKADALVKEMLGRVAEINEKDELVFRVKRVRAFGSYASDAPEVGDIDLAVDWEQRYPDRDIIEQLLNRADASGKRLNTYMARLNYGEAEVEKLLKARSPYISIQSGRCPEKFGVPAKVLFPPAPSTEADPASPLLLLQPRRRAPFKPIRLKSGWPGVAEWAGYDIGPVDFPKGACKRRLPVERMLMAAAGRAQSPNCLCQNREAAQTVYVWVHGSTLPPSSALGTSGTPWDAP